MSFENLDQGNEQQQQSFEQAPQQQQNPDPVLQVGDRVFNDLDAVKTKITNQDSFIETLKRELDEARNQLNTVLDKQEQLTQDNQSNNKVEELLERLNQTGTESDNSDTSTVDPDEVVNRVLEQLDIRKNESNAATNLQKCMDKATEVYGEKVGEVVTATAQSVGMTLKEVDELAKKNPQVFEQLFIKKDSTKSTSQTYTTSQLRPENNQPVQSKPFMRMSSKEKAQALRDRMESID